MSVALAVQSRTCGMLSLYHGASGRAQEGSIFSDDIEGWVETIGVSPWKWRGATPASLWTYCSNLDIFSQLVHICTHASSHDFPGQR